MGSFATSLPGTAIDREGTSLPMQAGGNDYVDYWRRGMRHEA